MEKKIWEQRVAELEFINDQLVCEIQYIDKLLRAIGFPDGLITIKNAAKEVLGNEELGE